MKLSIFSLSSSLISSFSAISLTSSSDLCVLSWSATNIQVPSDSIFTVFSINNAKSSAVLLATLRARPFCGYMHLKLFDEARFTSQFKAHIPIKNALGNSLVIYELRH
jgi:hypothetical protein